MKQKLHIFSIALGIIACVGLIFSTPLAFAKEKEAKPQKEKTFSESVMDNVSQMFNNFGKSTASDAATSTQTSSGIDAIKAFTKATSTPKEKNRTRVATTTATTSDSTDTTTPEASSISTNDSANNSDIAPLTGFSYPATTTASTTSVSGSTSRPPVIPTAVQSTYSGIVARVFDSLIPEDIYSMSGFTRFTTYILVGLSLACGLVGVILASGKLELARSTSSQRRYKFSQGRVVTKNQ